LALSGLQAVPLKYPASSPALTFETGTDTLLTAPRSIAMSGRRKDPSACSWALSTPDFIEACGLSTSNRWWGDYVAYQQAIQKCHNTICRQCPEYRVVLWWADDMQVAHLPHNDRLQTHNQRSLTEVRILCICLGWSLTELCPRLNTSAPPVWSLNRSPLFSRSCAGEIGSVLFVQPGCADIATVLTETVTSVGSRRG